MTSTAGDTAEALPEAFFLRDGDGDFRATTASQGPWDPGLLHGGAPAALLAAVIEEQTGRPDLRVARVSIDFFGPVPLAKLHVAVKILRPGKRIQLSEAELTHDGKLVAVARAWQHAVSTTPDPAPDAPASTLTDRAAPPLPEPDTRLSPQFSAFGYGLAMEWRTTSGSLDAPGPAAVWARPRVPLIDATPTTGLQRSMLLADCANGISLSLPLDRYLSMPTSLTVSFLRYPEGEWVHMDARTDFSGDGIGLSSAQQSDDTGLVATVAQPLLITAR